MPRFFCLVRGRLKNCWAGYLPGSKVGHLHRLKEWPKAASSCALAIAGLQEQGGGSDRTRVVDQLKSGSISGRGGRFGPMIAVTLQVGTGQRVGAAPLSTVDAHPIQAGFGQRDARHGEQLLSALLLELRDFL